MSIENTPKLSGNVSAYAGKVRPGILKQHVVEVLIHDTNSEKVTSICLSCIKPSLKEIPHDYEPITVRNPTTQKTVTVYIQSIQKRALEFTEEIVRSETDRSGSWIGGELLAGEEVRKSNEPIEQEEVSLSESERIQQVFEDVSSSLKLSFSVAYKANGKIHALEKEDGKWSMKVYPYAKIVKGAQAVVLVTKNVAKKYLITSQISQATSVEQTKAIAEKETAMEEATPEFNLLTDFTPIQRTLQKEEEGITLIAPNGKTSRILGCSYQEPTHLGDCEGRKIEPGKFCLFAACIAYQLMELHKHKIYHTDIKPANMIAVGKTPHEQYRLADMNGAWEAEKPLESDKEFLVSSNMTTAFLEDKIRNSQNENERERTATQIDLLALASSIFSVLTAAAKGKAVEELNKEERYPYTFKKHGMTDFVQPLSRSSIDESHNKSEQEAFEERSSELPPESTDELPERQAITEMPPELDEVLSTVVTEELRKNIPLALNEIPDLLDQQKTQIKDTLCNILIECSQNRVLSEEELKGLSEQLLTAFPKQWIVER